MEFCFKNVIAYKLVCFMLFSTCLIHSCGSSVHAIASLDSFTSVFCHVELSDVGFTSLFSVHLFDTYVGSLFVPVNHTFISSFYALQEPRRHCMRWQ